MITFGSGCSGIEAASVAWEPIGFKPVWFSQFDPEHDYSKGPDYPSAVLQHHWPHIPNLGDLTTVRHQIELGYDAPDVFVAGTPCQAYSVAGLREGLADARGALTLEYVKILDTIDEQRQEQQKPACIGVWENVPGVLSSADNAFGCLLGGLAGSDCELEPGPRPAAGKGSRIWRWCEKTRRHLPRWTNAGCVFGPKRAVAWRVLDAQYFGVAQRRRRVFVVASAREGFDPTSVLFEREGVRRDTAPSRETGSVVAALTANGVGTCGADDNQAPAGRLIPVAGYRMVAFGEYADDNTASCMKARDYKDVTDLVVMTVHGTQDPDVNVDVAHTLGRNQGQENVVFVQSRVRRLTPIECERLQGFPDGHTDILYQGKPVADSHRYKALGNSMATVVMQWIGKRIKKQIEYSEFDNL